MMRKCTTELEGCIINNPIYLAADALMTTIMRVLVLSPVAKEN